MARPIVLILLCAFAVQAIRVRETQSRAVFINIPLIPAHLERYLNSSLKPRLYNNSAWITINAYKIDYLETPIGHRTSEVDDGEVWDFVPGLSGYMVKTMAHVTQADGSLPGQMVVDMDLSLIHISEPTRLLSISYAVFCLKKKKKKKYSSSRWN
eukprot:TRINITY_DN4406_c0_g1_i6.p2 TRINITY_DN4406_c0_g1~~TRINITY_DN4406_c0_g1_i6.p2  ORF type:complete len:155 (-),score=49.33 TRINITY_DN4406_c0_g1_i6:10-474(-)